MGVGKYSPTVSRAYMMDQEWHRKNTTDPESAVYDDDGYDSYGYDHNDIDRAGVHENDYIVGEWIDQGTEHEQYVHERYDTVSGQWTAEVVDGKVKPVERK